MDEVGGTDEDEVVETDELEGTAAVVTSMLSRKPGTGVELEMERRAKNERMEVVASIVVKPKPKEEKIG
jgi:hypothetical protein